jgi:3'-phosphoadenosine 5'-phosphosulfate sulfotransferase
MSVRVQDFALIVGHVWRCSSCRDALMERPETLLLGYKVSDAQRSVIMELTDESFQTLERLSAITGLSTHELDAAIEHPRARLRHLGSSRGEYYIRPNGNG